MKTSLSLSSVGFAFKVFAWAIVLYALAKLRSNDLLLGYSLDCVGIGLFWAAGKLQQSKEWARLLFWGLSLFMSIYLFSDYVVAEFLSFHMTTANMWELFIALCFLWIFRYLNQPRLKYMFVLQSGRNSKR